MKILQKKAKYKKKKKKKSRKNLKWTSIPDHSYRLSISGGAGSARTNALLQIKKRDDDDSSIVDKIYLYVKDPNELIQRILMYY